MENKIKPGPKGPHKDPKMLKVPFNTRIPKWIVDELKGYENQALITETALIAYLNLKKLK